MDWLYWFITALAATGWGLFAWKSFQVEELKGRIAELYHKPLSYWSQLHASREMLRIVHESSREMLKTWTKPREIVRTGCEIVTFRRPVPFNPKVSDMVETTGGKYQRPGAEL